MIVFILTRNLARQLMTKFHRQLTQHTSSAARLPTCAAGHVQQFGAVGGAQSAHQGVLPQTVGAETHGVVHQVVLGRHAGEHLVHWKRPGRCERVWAG